MPAGGTALTSAATSRSLAHVDELRFESTCTPARGGAERDLGAGEHVGLLHVGAAVREPTVELEALLDLVGRAAHPLRAVVADQRDVRAFERADHGGREADHAGRAEDRDPQAL